MWTLEEQTVVCESCGYWTEVLLSFLSSKVFGSLGLARPEESSHCVLEKAEYWFLGDPASNSSYPSVCVRSSTQWIRKLWDLRESCVCGRVFKPADFISLLLLQCHLYCCNINCVYYIILHIVIIGYDLYSLVLSDSKAQSKFSIFKPLLSRWYFKLWLTAQFNYSFYEKFPENMINVLLNRNSKNIFVKFWIWNSKNSPEFRWPI